MLNDLNDTARRTLLEEMQATLDSFHDGLSFEISDATANGRTLTFSAEGDTDLFRYIVALVDEAPDVDWWEFVAFKQPQGKGLKVFFDRYRFDTTKMHFMQLECEDEPDMLGLRIALPKEMMGDRDDDLQVGVYVTIEALIGEFDCATLIGYLDTCETPAEPFKSGFRPMDDLPEFVEWFKKKRDSEN